MSDWMQVLGSSHVIAIRYHEPSRECWVKFAGEVVYVYEDVSPEEWEELVHSSSKGKFVNLVLRRGHSYHRADTPTQDGGVDEDGQAGHLRGPTRRR
jgi:KTSC domain